MWKKTGKQLIVTSLVFLLSGCGYWYNLKYSLFGDSYEDDTPQFSSQSVSNTPLRNPKSIVVCRSRQCAPAKLSMSREYIYNSLVHLFENNNHQTALICEANAASRTCTENYLTMPLKVGVTPAHMYIDSVNITDVIIGSKNQQINLVLNYNVTYNGQSPDCTPAKSVSFARNVNHIMLEDIGYKCKMTTIGHSTIKTVLAIDYIDLDFGFIGGYYSIGVSGPAYGGGSGYMLLRLPKYSEKLSPVLVDPERNKAPKTSQTTKFTRQQTQSQAASSTSRSSNDGFMQSGVQIFPLEPKKTPESLPQPEEVDGSTSAQETAPAEVPQNSTTSTEDKTTEASSEQNNTQSEQTEAPRPEQPMQIAPTSYSVTSGNKLAEELKKINNQK